MSRLFITGGTGFIGSHLAHYLAEQGHQLSLLVRDNTTLKDIKGRPAIPKQAKLIQGELLEPDSYFEALKDCDAAIHLAADYRVGLAKRAIERKKMYRTNVLGSLALADTALKAQIPRFIYASSTAAFGETQHLFPDESAQHNSVFRCYYEETKHIAHQYLMQRQQQGLPLVMGIFGGVFGTGDQAALSLTMRDFLNGKLPAQPDSTSRFQLCHVSHICKAFELLLNHQQPEPAYLFTGQDYSMPEVIATLAKVSGKPEPKKVSVKILKIPAFFMEQLSRFGFKFPLSKEVINIMDGSTYMYSSAKAQAELGWSAGDTQQELKEYIQSLINEMATPLETKNKGSV